MSSKKFEDDSFRRSIHGFLRDLFQQLQKSIAVKQLTLKKLMKKSMTYSLPYTVLLPFGKGRSSTGSEKNSLIFGCSSNVHSDPHNPRVMQRRSSLGLTYS